MKISDVIADMILDMFDDNKSTVQIQRNDLAARVGCVPSQINYVLTSRFSPEQGYIIESRRGGGGYIKITRATVSATNLIMHVVNSIGNRLDKNTARIILENLAYQGSVTPKAAALMLSAVSDKALMAAKVEDRDYIRADILKNMMLSL